MECLSHAISARFRGIWIMRVLGSCIRSHSLGIRNGPTQADAVIQQGHSSMCLPFFYKLNTINIIVNGKAHLKCPKFRFCECFQGCFHPPNTVCYPNEALPREDGGRAIRLITPKVNNIKFMTCISQCFRIARNVLSDVENLIGADKHQLKNTTNLIKMIFIVKCCLDSGGH